MSRSLSETRLNSCTGLDTVERDGQFEGVRVRVYLWNKEEKVLFFKNYDLTAQQICNEMAKKNLLTQDSRNMFSLWIVGNNLGTISISSPFQLHLNSLLFLSLSLIHSICPPLLPLLSRVAAEALSGCV